MSADVTKETNKELWWRWTKNIGLNLATLPIAVASIFIPVTLPISVTISTSIFEPSPDRIYAELVVLDTRTGKVVYQNDDYYTTVPEDEDLAEVADRLLEEFCVQWD